MSTIDAPPIAPATSPAVQLPRTDSLAALVSYAVAILAALGLVPLGLTAEQLLAIGSGLFGLVATARTLWERRAELNRQRVLEATRQGQAVAQYLLEQTRARHALDQQRIDQVARLAAKAADPNDPTTLTPGGLLALLESAVDPNATTTPISLMPEPGTFKPGPSYGE